ncbi:hypothetical protein E2562_018495 [Oryza meyeriana var. granulata]|uniref:Uncharacterized protein n=1 Tax=Oryza meyeriana var. granulata TaxID=110450 RepID=A0A6G1EMK3_9ORYZ|nr:hypothetical protein E2562_018495 [Oryza meyeriana var. granulata]
MGISLGALVLVLLAFVLPLLYLLPLAGKSLYGDVNRGSELRKVLSDFAELLGTKPVRDLLPWLGWTP